MRTTTASDDDCVISLSFFTLQNPTVYENQCL